jgi:hypothetical protein
VPPATIKNQKLYAFLLSSGPQLNESYRNENFKNGMNELKIE